VRSADVTGALGSVVGTLAGLLAVAVVVAVWVAAWRSESTPARVVRDCAAVVAAQVALGRVLSPQFVLWLVPLVPLVAGRRGRLASALLAATLVMTHLWFPELYRDYVNERGAPETAYLLVRNGLLVVLLVVLAAPSLRSLLSPSSPTAAKRTKAGTTGIA
jgi:hypothetical protein